MQFFGSLAPKLFLVLASLFELEERLLVLVSNTISLSGELPDALLQRRIGLLLLFRHWLHSGEAKCC